MDFIDPTMSWKQHRAEVCAKTGISQWLSPAEQVVALEVKKGMTNREIAVALGKSLCTVKGQVASILHKFGMPTRGRLIALLHDPAIERKCLH
ncbi:MAG: hypothetical protein JWM35_1269 [Verrucomicrobia bacterium]|nr:hypothetical protein [Verrucomicrobiota bacterium]